VRFSSLMRGLTIRFRMLSAIAVVLALLGLLGGAGIFGMFRIHDISEKVITRSLTWVEHLTSIRYSLALIRRHEKDMIIQYERPEAVKRIRASWQEDLERTGMSLTELQASVSTDREDVFIKILAHLRSYEALYSQVAAQLEASGYDSATTANRMSARAVAEFDAADRLLAEMHEALRQQAAEALEIKNLVLKQTLIVFAGLVVLTVVIVVPLTLINMQAICRPLEEAQGLSHAIANGDLSQSILVVGCDEVADLQCSLERMRDRLGSIVSQVLDSSEYVATASREIAIGNQDLSLRTEQTAGNVQQTGSSIALLTRHVEQTFRSAQLADQLAAEASAAAVNGGEVVEQVAQSMRSISEASYRINGIIELIDSIAFQTNILALNAAVEAARAGEFGRGFAVVASEVRSLSQRAAAAAGEIKGLIGNSVVVVEAGVKLTQEAGNAMADIVSGVKRVNDIIGEIAAAAGSQTNGIAEVSRAAREIDRMTQQNAALVEQSTAATESLREQADRLAQMVRQFRLATPTALLVPPHHHL
jgi:methyl-accepting chemotaxis protein